jgi:lipoteichoic acid synthase
MVIPPVEKSRTIIMQKVMRLIKQGVSAIYQLCQKKPAQSNLFALAFFFLFLIAYTFKLAMFDNLLYDPNATIFTCVEHSGMIKKYFIIFFFSTLLVLWKRPVFFIAFYFLQTLYMFINMSYHYYFEGYLHINQYLGMFSEVFDLIKHKALPPVPFLWFLFLDFPFFIMCLIFYKKISKFNYSFVIKKSFYLIAGLIVFLAVSWDPIDPNANVLNIMNDAYSSDSHVVKKYGLLAFNFFDLLKYKDIRTRVQSINYGRAISLSESDTAHPNFILIQLESIDSYIINFRYKRKLVTPFLNLLSKQSVFYPFTLSFHKAGSTSDCEFSTISSIEPFDDFPSIKLRNYDYPNSMLKPLAKAGYDVLAFHGNRGSYFNRHIALKKMGFAYFYDMMAMKLEEKAWGAPDGEVFNYVQNKLKTQKSPFFYYIITMSSHEPFNLMQSYYSTNAYDDSKDELLKRFLTAMSYVDGELEKFVGSLRKNLKNTYIFIYGDHTPAIPNAVYRRASFSKNSVLFEFVPCFIITPEGTIFNETNQIASFLDIAPTILRASKISFEYRSNGVDLLFHGQDTSNIAYNGNIFARSILFSQIKNQSVNK